MDMDTRKFSRIRGGAGHPASIQIGMAMAAALALGACSSVPDAVNPVQWYKSAEQAVSGNGQATGDTQAASAEAGAPAYTPPEISGRNQPFPNLGEGPERPVARTPAETGQLTEGLVADRARAQHSERGIPLQGMSGERRTGFAAVTDGGFPSDTESPTIAGAPSSPQVIRTEINRAPAPRAAGARQVAGPAGVAGEAEQARGSTRARSSAPAPGMAATTSAPRRTSGAPSGMAFSDAPPPSAASPSPSPPSSPPPRPRFTDVAPPTLGLSSVPPPRRQAAPAQPPITATADFPPPPALPSGAPSAPPGIADAPEDAPEDAPAGVREGRAEEQNAQDVSAGAVPDTVPGTMAALDQRADEAAEPARSERIATIQFGREAAELGEPEREILRQVAALHQQRGGMIRVVGHGGIGDSEGQGGTMKEQVSLERANVVAQELIRLGISRQEIRAVALAGAPAGGEADAQAAEIYFVY